MIVREEFGTLSIRDGIVNTNPNSKGTANAGTTAVEKGDGIRNVSVLTVDTTIPAVTAAATAVGKLLYTFPSGDILVHGAYMSLGLTDADGNIDADTPDVGIGTVIATGAVSLLNGTATFEDIITGQTATDCSGTATAKVAGPTAGTALAIDAADAHTVHMNFADTWAADTLASAMGVAGTVVLEWSLLKQA